MAGPALALVILRVADVAVRLDDTTGPAINYRTIYQLIALSVIMLAVTAVRLRFVARQSDQPG
jgi:hypothetical protein